MVPSILLAGWLLDMSREMYKILYPMAGLCGMIACYFYHTLHVPATNDEVTDVWFAIHGANLNLAADGSVELVIDAHAILPFYRAACAEQHGISDPPVVVIGG